jgi:CTP:molybdopterin cytidylyltransferase MocA
LDFCLFFDTWRQERLNFKGKDILYVCVMNVSFSAIIAAAGTSARMGCPKALLRHNSGVSFLRFLLNGYLGYGCDPLVVVAGQELDRPEWKQGGHHLVINHQPEMGRSFSLFLGFQRIPEGSACFIHNVDNPCLVHDLLETLAANALTDGYIVPVFQGRGGHPVLLGPKVIETAKTLIPPFDFRDLLKGFKKYEVEWPGGDILLNINTQTDYLLYSAGCRE